MAGAPPKSWQAYGTSTKRLPTTACGGNSFKIIAAAHAQRRLVATDAFSRGPLSRDYRPFIGRILKGSKGSIPVQPIEFWP